MLQMSAYSATNRRVTLRPLPPMRMGRRALDRRRLVDGPDHVVVGAGGTRSCAVEHPPDDRQRLPEPAQSFGRAVTEFEAEAPVLGLAPGAADAEDGPSAAEVVEGGDHLGQEGWIAIRIGADHQADGGPRRQGGDRRHQHVGLEDGSVDRTVGRIDVVGCPERVVTQRLGTELRGLECRPVGVWFQMSAPSFRGALMSGTESILMASIQGPFHFRLSQRETA